MKLELTIGTKILITFGGCKHTGKSPFYSIEEVKSETKTLVKTENYTFKKEYRCTCNDLGRLYASFKGFTRCEATPIKESNQEQVEKLKEMIDKALETGETRRLARKNAELIKNIGTLENQMKIQEFLKTLK